ncbi:MAG: hypothetical protein WCO03_00125 [bacterium]
MRKTPIIVLLVIICGVFYFFFWPNIAFNIKAASFKRIHLTEINDPKIVAYIKGLPSKVDMAQGGSYSPQYTIKVTRYGNCGDAGACHHYNVFYMPNRAQSIEILDNSSSISFVDTMNNIYVSRYESMYAVKDGVVWGVVDNSGAFQVTGGNYYMASDNRYTYIIPYSNLKMAFKLTF